ncbi:hypothetical protein EDB87DRAFT_961914 [Lactarius vividus]|nr:hypothetical protein EDB87DRAFT_961914 [Lactarius vividus]
MRLTRLPALAQRAWLAAWCQSYDTENKTAAELHQSRRCTTESELNLHPKRLLGDNLKTSPARRSQSGSVCVHDRESDISVLVIGVCIRRQTEHVSQPLFFFLYKPLVLENRVVLVPVLA